MIASSGARHHAVGNRSGSAKRRSLFANCVTIVRPYMAVFEVAKLLAEFALDYAKSRSIDGEPGVDPDDDYFIEQCDLVTPRPYHHRQGRARQVSRVRRVARPRPSPRCANGRIGAAHSPRTAI
jgi:hypothetical protein